ncbi:MAG: T9SS type A sorting domain-containing protein [Bacteroides sp.]|nr:T9SS type A sorting domain-containing protein [Ruminococcus flavefaciens]MCM1554995.1 T9SS type A sorting domain-containing protein [Bacteroides sp.]
MKAKHILAVFCGLLLSECLSAQMEEFRFKLYLESLSSGKKDTLELGVGPNGYGWGGRSWNGWHDCLYDSLLCPVYAEPFFDTVNHVGAFVVPGTDGYRYHEDTLRVLCPFYAKKRIGILAEDMVVVFPIAEQPVKVSWDKTLLQSLILKTPVLTTFEAGSRYDVLHPGYWTPIRVDMSVSQDCEVGYAFEGNACDSIEKCAYIRDSLGTEHPYIYFFILTGQDLSASATPGQLDGKIFITPNPVQRNFRINGVESLKKWQLFSLSGTILKEGHDEEYVDIHDYPSGIYIFRWENKSNKAGLIKLIKR